MHAPHPRTAAHERSLAEAARRRALCGSGTDDDVDTIEEAKLGLADSRLHWSLIYWMRHQGANEYACICPQQAQVAIEN